MDDVGETFSDAKDDRQSAGSAKGPALPEYPLPSPVTEVKEWGNKVVATLQACGLGQCCNMYRKPVEELLGWQRAECVKVQGCLTVMLSKPKYMAMKHQLIDQQDADGMTANGWYLFTLLIARGRPLPPETVEKLRLELLQYMMRKLPDECGSGAAFTYLGEMMEMNSLLGAAHFEPHHLANAARRPRPTRTRRSGYTRTQALPARSAPRANGSTSPPTSVVTSAWRPEACAL